eukprot:4930510-Pyramimonas_sp.AAC.1
MHSSITVVDAEQIQSQLDCKDLGLEKVRLDDVSDHGPKRWKGTDTDRTQRTAQLRWFDVTEAAMHKRRESALQGKTAYHSNSMAVFAWLPKCQKDALPSPKNPYKVEKTRKMARRWIRFQNEHLGTPATGPNAVAPPSVWWPYLSRWVMEEKACAVRGHFILSPFRLGLNKPRRPSSRNAQP